ncbi:CHAD domain-containing protein [Geotalea uraniireducens]|uniref:CHAD domain containing protein n=1 Tax=Geotalea uraniireducens (strain Rf4) TaxID=351605 RepID=A5G4U8_GEOUR|nr:CHAD domain-containing protein [Geotalea uraniireducens]ABQ26816.1 CHAD domain containing protein [Geotalea uraniireducens Rf4]
MKAQVEGATPLWIACRLLLSERGDDFFARRDKALATADAEDIHDLRVASRRLREGLALFASCYPPAEIAPLGKSFRRVTRALGAIRNTDEALLFFTSLAEEFGDPYRAELAHVQDSFRVERKKELKRLRAALREFAPWALRRGYLRVVSAPSLFASGISVDPFVPLSVFARQAIDAGLSAVMELVPQARRAGEIEAQHRLRIAVKHFRYRAEILEGLFGAGFPELCDRLKAYQDVLGRMHDLDVFAGIVRDAKLAGGTGKTVLNAIATRREGLFAEFTGMLDTMSPEKIGERLRSAL